MIGAFEAPSILPRSAGNGCSGRLWFGWSAELASGLLCDGEVLSRLSLIRSPPLLVRQNGKLPQFVRYKLFYDIQFLFVKLSSRKRTFRPNEIAIINKVSYRAE